MAFDIFWMNAAAVFALANVAFVLSLLGLYFQSWRIIPSGVTFGLLVFAAFFLVQNVVIVVFWWVLYGLVPSAQAVVVGAAPYLTAINAAESVALANLVRVSWR